MKPGFSLLTHSKRFALATLVACAVACSDDDANSGPPKTTPVPGGPTSQLVVWVLDEGVGAFDAITPLANVEVAFDPPGGGERVLSRTDAEGRVVIEADFTREGAALTVASPDHVITSALNISPAYTLERPNLYGKPPADLVLVPPRLDRAALGSTIELRGALVGKQGASIVDVSVSELRRLGSDTTSDASYVLRAPRGRPFVLLAHEQSIPAAATEPPEHLKSLRIDVPARDTDGVLDIDITGAAALPSTAYRFHGDLPLVAPFIDEGRCIALVKSGDSDLLLGGFLRRVSSGCDIEVSVADTAIAPESAITTMIFSAEDGSRSVRSELGVLANDAHLDGFLVPPTVDDASRSIADAIPIDRIDAATDVHVDVYAANQLLWVLDGPLGRLRTPALELPEPFGVTFTADVNLFALVISARKDRVQLPSGKAIWRREATSRDVIVRRQ